jgi:putative flippase GtrA
VNAVTTSSRLSPAQAFLRDIRSPEWGLAGQGIRFALSGSLVAVVYLTVTTVLHDAFGVHFQIALAVGFTAGIALHFTLQRLFVWRHHQSFALPIGHQALRYLCLCCGQYALTALSTAKLPSLLGLPVEAVYLVTALGLAGLNFLVFRGRIFHPDSRDVPVAIAERQSHERG